MARASCGLSLTSRASSGGSLKQMVTWAEGLTRDTAPSGSGDAPDPEPESGCALACTRHHAQAAKWGTPFAIPRAAPWTPHNATRYASLVIRSFGNTMTERLWSLQRTRKLDPRIERTALRKLVIVDAAETLDDLRVPPGNRLEALRGDRSGQHSIRINQQWRVCFTWTPAGPENVEIVDYH